jgi:hypothetical protein
MVFGGLVVTKQIDIGSKSEQNAAVQTTMTLSYVESREPFCRSDGSIANSPAHSGKGFGLRRSDDHRTAAYFRH